ncbi:exodeoxyribonuclease 7 large subunit [Aliidongia dinghuensis]|uniref:Exodeoxyribonuclease 7 large subunit n=1 Tax=Aliidongia dinghuensis TaxID=1867774 RepID=A0A8J3E366_9PROT|nr:exodeoxyribonuclease VII large subunit [Aliidongia dinghuensis]GGF16083.1 exodeoxyribonuclease 7 large subunit [Aliidongia dinghuensis]
MVSDTPSSEPGTPAAGARPTNVPVYSVSELSGALKRTIEQAYGYVRVRGEISGCKRHSSGHIYLALKDMDAVMDAVCWRGTAGRLKVEPADGVEVIATGRLTTFPGRSKYQMVIEQMELAGEGALLKLLEERKRKLAAEGLFATERKRPLPYLPHVIGVVTSPTGAVIRDILHRLNERFPRHVLLWPVAVQGEGAAEQVARAIDGFNRIAPGGPVPRPDVLIVARGGGSLEDLMAFNEEIVVRAAAASRIPLISAVGHETDTTLIDFASDRRAPTPTAAAEMAVPVRLDLLTEVRSLGSRLDAASARLVDDRRMRLEGLARGLPDPVRLIETAEQRLDDRAERLKLSIAALLRDRAARVATAAAQLKHPRQQIAEHERHLVGTAARLAPALERLLERATERLDQAGMRLAAVPLLPALDRRGQDLAGLGERLDAAARRDTAQRGERLERLAQVLESLSPFKVLERGYAVVEDRAGQPLTAPAITPGMALTLRFHDATVPARAEDGPAALGNPPPAAQKPAKKPKPPAEDRQQSLF